MLDESEQYTIFHSKKPLTLKLGYERFQRTKESIMNETFLPLTVYQIRKVRSAVRSKTSVEIKLSSKQLDFICKGNKRGGFLPALLAALPVLSALATTVVNSVNNKRANDKLVTERIRHNRVMEDTINKKGSGVKGNDLYSQLMKQAKKKKLHL